MSVQLITVNVKVNMSVIETGLFQVMQKFPDCKPSIKRLFDDGGEFKTICEDYGKCFAALHHWNQFSDEIAPKRKQEYSDLLAELEEEIHDYLAVSP